jgi:hypothetical protein
LPFLPEITHSHPVHIAAGQSVGSGFYLNMPNATYIVTAKHVLFKDGLELYDEAILTSVGTDLTTKMVVRLNCQMLFASGLLKKHDTADVAVAKIATRGTGDQSLTVSFTQGVTARHNPVSDDVAMVVGMPSEMLRRFDQVEVSNRVLMLGYPASLGLEAQIDRTRPLLRSGIVAGKTEDGRIIIDCPVYFGNSGALVLECDETSFVDRIIFFGIGIATHMVPFVEELWSKQFKIKAALRFENSGYALVEPMDRVEDLL